MHFICFQVGECLASLRMVAACFPVRAAQAAGPAGAAGGRERAALLRLLQRQLAGERAAGAAAAASRRLQLPDALPGTNDADRCARATIM